MTVVSHVKRIAVDRERFLEGAGSPLAVRPEIADSWRRSVLSGVPADRFPSVPIDDLSERDTRLLRAARPVLDRLADELAGTVTSIILTDPDARILARRVGERTLQSSLDRIFAVPGARYGEEVVGTNGLGTVIERRLPTMVAGSEHFHEMLQSLTCVGAPLVHPVTGRLEGVLDLTCRVEDTNALMLPMVLEAARDIKRGLYDLASTAERLLLERFLLAARRSNRPLIAFNREIIITNAAASRMLEPADHAVLWESAERAIGLGEPFEEVVLGRGVVRCTRVEPIATGADVTGLLIELDLPGEARRGRARYRTGPSDAGLPGLAGRSPEWRHVCDTVREQAGTHVGVAVLGQPGTGKLAVARALHELAATAGDPTVVDAALVPAEGSAPWQARLASSLAAPGTVIVGHADLLPAELAFTVASLSENAHPECRLVATAGESWPLEAPRALVDRFPARITVPPLARRTADIPVLLSAISARFGAGQLRWTAAATQALTRGRWPGNVRELASLVERITARRTAGDVGLADLPPEYRSAPGRRPLTVLEQLECDAIVRALAEAEGNKNDAAALLGISRSTLYRKLAAYGIDLDRAAF